MNWYKQSQLQDTLPYFQEFEEYGEYVPDEDSLNNKLKSIGLSISNEISSGDSGVAYLLSNGDVLKITTNDQEGKVADYLIQNPHSSIIRYKNIWKEGDLYFIIMDHIDKMISDIPALKNIFDNIHKTTDSFNCYRVDCAYDIVLKDNYFNLLPSTIKNIIKGYLEHLKSIPIPIFDFLNSNNIGIQDGKIKFFDIT